MGSFFLPGLDSPSGLWWAPLQAINWIWNNSYTTSSSHPYSHPPPCHRPSSDLFHQRDPQPKPVTQRSILLWVPWVFYHRKNKTLVRPLSFQPRKRSLKILDSTTCLQNSKRLSHCILLACCLAFSYSWGGSHRLVPLYLWNPSPWSHFLPGTHVVFSFPIYLLKCHLQLSLPKPSTAILFPLFVILTSIWNLYSHLLSPFAW